MENKIQIQYIVLTQNPESLQNWCKWKMVRRGQVPPPQEAVICVWVDNRAIIIFNNIFLDCVLDAISFNEETGDKV